MRGMHSFSVAPHANPGDEFFVLPRNSDFPPEIHDKPVAKGKVKDDVTLSADLKPGDYWAMVGNTSIRFAVGDQPARDEAHEKQRLAEQKDADELAERNRKEKQDMIDASEERPDPEPQNRPPNPEDQPNELPIGDNTGTTRTPTGEDVAKTGPVKPSGRTKKA